MPDTKPIINKQDLGIPRPQWVRIMVFQLETILSDWKKEKGLYYPSNLEKFKTIINSVLKKAETERVNLLVFPELSIPKECIKTIKDWSRKNETIIVAGSHYDKDGNGKTISKCPVIFKNQVFYTEKINPAPAERSPLPNHGLSQGQGIYVFENSPIGNFAVLICSDNLMTTAKDLIKGEKLDFWIVPSFQRDSEWHYIRMTSDVEDTRNSRYIIYANNKLYGEGDGSSSFFGVTNKVSINDFIENGYTGKTKFKRKLITLSGENDYFILDVDIEFKRPSDEKFPEDEPNIVLVAFSSLIKDSLKSFDLTEDLQPNEQVPIDKKELNIYEEDKDILETFHKFTLENYLKKNLHFEDNNSDELFNRYSSVFVPVVEIKKGSELLSLDNETTFFQKVGTLVENSESQNPLLVTGYAGCGKSAFLSVLYWFLYLRFKKGESNKLPVLINLHHYNKQIYSEKKQKYFEQATKKLLTDLKPIYTYILKHREKEVIIIIDGADEYDNPKVDLDDFITTEIAKLSVKTKVIGLRKHRDEHTKSYSKTKTFPLIEDPEIELVLSKVKVESPRFLKFIQAFAEVESNPANKTTTVIKDYIVDKVKKFKLEEIDFFLAILLLKGVKADYRYGKAKSLSSFYKIYIEDCKLNINKSAELAFKIFNKHNEVTDKEKNQEEWWVIQKHETLRDFLVAYNIVKKLVEYNPKNQDVFNFVYPYDLNNFCKEIVNEEATLQKKALDSIQKLFGNVELTAQTHLCYLLGRFEDKFVKESSKTFLQKIKNDAVDIIREKIPFDSTKRLTSEDKKHLLFLRTIYISLTYLGDEVASSEYIKQLIHNKYFDTLNRGFHLEYYEDITFSPASPDSLKHEDDLNDFSKTFNRLYKKLEIALNTKSYYSMFQIELYTLCSLAQHRQANGNLENIKRINITDLINKTLEKYRNLDYDLFIYLKFIKEQLKTEGKFKIATFTKDLFSLKSLQRKGWLKRNVSNPETVAAHMYGAFMLGYLHLPTHVHGEPTYDKAEILRMILIHDLGEAYLGDLTPEEKTTETSKREERQFEYLSLIGTYEGLSSVTDIVNLFKNFTHDKKNINCIIAREIDKLDNLLQLYIYHYDSAKGPINDFKYFKADLIGDISSEIGRKIMNQIEELFEE